MERIDDVELESIEEQIEQERHEELMTVLKEISTSIAHSQPQAHQALTDALNAIRAVQSGTRPDMQSLADQLKATTEEVTAALNRPKLRMRLVRDPQTNLITEIVQIQ